MRESFRRAGGGTPLRQPRNLELPEDIADEETDVILIPASYHRRPIADEKALVHAAEAILEAKHPLLMIGAAANRKRVQRKMLRESHRQERHTVLHHPNGQRRGRRRPPLVAGQRRAIRRRFCPPRNRARRLHHQCRPRRHREAAVLHAQGPAQGDPRQFLSERFLEVDTVYFPQIELIGDIANSVWRLKEAVEARPQWDFSYFTKVRKHLDTHLLEGRDDARWPIYPQRLVADVRKVMPSDGILCLDNGMYKIWFARYYRCREPNTMLLDNALATMGAGLPSAIAAKIVHPKRKVVAVAGDGGFMMNSQEIETAVRLKLDLTVLLLRDNAYGMIKWKQANMKFANFGMDMGNPDFVEYVQSYGRRRTSPRIGIGVRADAGALSQHAGGALDRCAD